MFIAEKNRGGRTGYTAHMGGSAFKNESAVVFFGCSCNGKKKKVREGGKRSGHVHIILEDTDAELRRVFYSSHLTLSSGHKTLMCHAMANGPARARGQMCANGTVSRVVKMLVR
jgi:hypothetical protein